MINSLYSSISGLKAFTEQISVTSDNIANVETTAYKSSSVSFADLLNSALTGPTQETVGAGVEVQGIYECWNQGSLTTDGNSTDLAINGSGFFIVQDPDTGVTYYTRDGSFEFGSDGTLVNSSSMAVQGYTLDENGNLGSLGDIVLSYKACPPEATTEMSTVVNLCSTAEEGDTFSTTTTVYDSLGNAISLTITYTKGENANEWTYEAGIPDTYGTLAGDITGVLTFSTSGTLTSGTDPVFTMSLTNGADDTQTITWDLYKENGNANGNLTQYSTESVLTSQTQDGYASGSLYDVTVDENGIVTGSYSNGQTQKLYQIALADFNHYDGLKKVSDNLYEATLDSGQATLGVSGIGQFGSINGGSLEMSNVDLATELANLIKAQRAYQACSRVFTASSEVLQTLVNMAK